MRENGKYDHKRLMCSIHHKIFYKAEYDYLFCTQGQPRVTKGIKSEWKTARETSLREGSEVFQR